MSKVALHALLKFGSDSNISDLYENGTIYFNTIESFRGLEDNNLRGDYYEGNSWVSNIRDGKVSLLDEKNVPVIIGEANSAHIRGYKEDLKGNLYCMYAIAPSSLCNNKLKIDKRVTEFGEYFLVVDGKKMNIFLNRIWEELDRAGINIYGANLVTYYDINQFVFKKTDIFCKRSEYSYQNEFRIFAQPSHSKSFSIRIGSLKEIAQVHKSDSIFAI